MAQYTFEDIEIIRQKSGISYEEAVNLLEYHNGSLARALVDLEKNGRLRDEKAHEQTQRTYGKNHHRSGLFRSLFIIRVKVFKGDIPILNLSLMFLILSLLLASWLVIFSAIAALLLGYRFAVERDTSLFGKQSFEDVIRNAGSNVRNTVFTMAKDWGAFDEHKVKKDDKEPTDASPKPPEPEKRTETPASGTTPVSVKFSEDGNVRVTEDKEGFHEADIQ